MKLSAALAVLFLCIACLSQPGERGGELPLLVASDLDNLPFAGVDAEGTAIGRDVEMMQALGQALGRPVSWRRMPFEELLDAVERGEVDAVCATLGITEERARRVGFTTPYFTTAIAVVVRTGRGEPRALADLSGRRVSGGKGTTSERAILRRLPGCAGVFENKTGADTLERLLTGEVDAAVMDGPAADALVEQGEGRLVRLPENLDEERYAIALPRTATKLRLALDAALADMHRSGRMKQLNERFGLSPNSP